ncbi:unnamed protein product [Cylindrotheca closterium]|uniref:Uncharacterized protein n=1 Tax=Cylindrotheca closterium TaxID=2856 RepID=A0AAD2CXA9_9STRA|nr:unnamed protein product [Cylindrotheca closterium]
MKLISQSPRGSEIRCCLDDAMEEFQQLQYRPSHGENEEGDLNKWGKTALDIVFAIFYHVTPVVFAFQGAFFKVFAGFVKAAGSALQLTLMRSYINAIVVTAVETSNISSYDNDLSVDKILNLEASGVLEQCLRVLPFVPGHQGVLLIYWTISSQLQSTGLLSKKFKMGKACGDVLRAILASEEDTLANRPDTIKRPCDTVTLVDEMDPDEEEPECLGEARYVRSYELQSDKVCTDLERCASTISDTCNALLIVRFPDGK